jgi:hypothetical protein
VIVGLEQQLSVGNPDTDASGTSVSATIWRFNASEFGRRQPARLLSVH